MTMTAFKIDFLEAYEYPLTPPNIGEEFSLPALVVLIVRARPPA
jgi:hypothetical protein